MRVLTLGTFDLFHRGHVQLLARCAALADGGRVIVGLNTDAFVREYKGRPSVVSFADRAAVLLACRYVDDVIANGRDAKPAILASKAQAIVVGDDWKERDYLGQLGVTQAWLDRQAIRIVYVPYTQGISSTEIRARVA